ncbi:MAG: glutamate formimidoyltransferase [Bacilli bacterium]|jgi:glutamate formiminotransferase
MQPRLLCIPNFSEGRDPRTLAFLRACFQGRTDLELLDYSADPDHNRSVFTLYGTPQALIAALMDAAAVALERIDLNIHRGVHPRIGAIDVIPFVPWGSIGLEETIELAHRVGNLLWERFSLPVYFYEQAAIHPDHKALPVIRHGQFEELKSRIHDPMWHPDCGEGVHFTAGITAVGVRAPLCAFNINLETTDIELAKRIASRIRERDGGLKGVRALGFDLPHLRCVQVSLNLTDCEAVTPLDALRFVQAEANLEQVSIRNTELIGMLPPSVISKIMQEQLMLTSFSTKQILPFPKED